ncbi:helix-turn-helix transcriptional regulator [Bacillus sp. AFS040349]|uniref:helix-turn-helix domain-containing protein n=1 Tax=Bacillus sp. AFS040349 TaxID=2033502 RepID=UPI0021006105|nr:helix-turn-helix transcriptional regulator [Bacillus sp. AFS040349]
MSSNKGTAVIYFSLEEVLKRKDLTQSQLSELTKIRPSTISDLKRRNALNLSHVAKICEVLNITDIREVIKLEYK